MGQERNSRAMLEYGMMFEKGLDGATEMRGVAPDLGMSVSEMLNSMTVLYLFQSKKKV